MGESFGHTAARFLPKKQQTGCGEQHGNPQKGKRTGYSTCPSTYCPNGIRSNKPAEVADGVDQADAGGR